MKSSVRSRFVRSITSTSARSVAGPADPLEQVERVGDQDAARRRRRVGEDLAAAVAGAGGLALDHLVGGEVVARSAEPPRSSTCSATRGRGVAAVEVAGPLGAQALEQVAELGQADRLAGLRGAARRARRSPAPSGWWMRIGPRISNRNACISGDLDALAGGRGGGRRPARPAAACRSARAPRATPSGRAVDAAATTGPTLKRWIASSEKRTSIGSRSARRPSVSPWPGAATKKSSRWSSPSAVWTSMNPPAPGPVSGDSATKLHQHGGDGGVDRVAARRSTSAPA